MTPVLLATIVVAIAFAWRLGHDHGREQQRARALDLQRNAVILDIGAGRRMMLSRAHADALDAAKREALDFGQRMADVAASTRFTTSYLRDTMALVRQMGAS